MPTLTLLAQTLQAVEGTTKSDALPRWLVVALYILGAAAVVAVPMLVAWLIATSFRVKDLQRRLAVVLFTATAAIAVVALRWHPTLGVDLSGGVILVYGVDLAASALSAPDEMAAEKTGATDETARVKERDIRKKKGADETDESEHVDMDALVQAISRRINPDGLKEISVRAFGVNQIEIVIPKAEGAEIDEIKRKIATAGVLLFRIVANTKDHNAIITRAREQLDDPLRKLAREVRDNSGTPVARWTPVAREAEKKNGLFPLKVDVSRDLIRDARTGELIVDIPREAIRTESRPTAFEEWLEDRGIESVEVLMVEPEAEVYDMRGDFLGRVNQNYDPRTNRPCVEFTTKGKGVKRMTALTTLNNPDTDPPFYRRLGIVLDNQLLSAPQIQSTIADRGQITGNFTVEEVRVLVGVLNAGKLPAVLFPEPISQNQIGPLLGVQTIRQGGLSTLVSLIIVFVFVWFYYRWAGMVACLALALNLLMTYALMIVLGASLTLPGLAGLVLTVGMSVDANVLIYERMREEMARGATLRMAIRNGFSRATATIVDSNLTTLITGVVLYAIGTDQVRGFAVTLILGILMCMYTAIYFSRLLFDLAERRKWITKLTMVQWVGETHIDFLKLKWPTIIASLVIIIAGLVAAFERGSRLLDVDFIGGTSVVMETVTPTTDAKAREELAATFRNIKVNGVTAQFTLTQMHIAEKKDGTVWKVDSSLQDVKQLQEVLQKSFELVTYKMTYTPPKQIALQSSSDRPDAESPSTESPSTESPSTEPSTEEPTATEPSTTDPSTSSTGDDDANSRAPAEGDADESEASGDAPADDAPSSDSTGSDEPATDSDGDEPSSTADPDEIPSTNPQGCQETIGSAVPESQPPTGTADTEPADTDPADTSSSESDTAESDTAESDTEESDIEEARPSPSAATVPSRRSTTTAGPQASVPVDDADQSAISEAGESDAETASNARSGSQTTIKLTSPLSKDALTQMIQTAATQLDHGYVSVNAVATTLDSSGSDASKEWGVKMGVAADRGDQILKAVQAKINAAPAWIQASVIGSQVAGDTRGKAIAAMFASFLGIIAYLWFRFHRIEFGLAAVIAVVHDVLVALAFIAFSHYFVGAFGHVPGLGIDEFKISLPVVAAFLTLIGYSLNDTIVIFDRLREIRGKSPDLTAKMVNDSVNQTLSRTLLTGGLTLSSVIILYFAGGEGIHPFAYTLVIGMIAGTYSTVFIASPALLWMLQRDKSEVRSSK